MMRKEKNFAVIGVGGYVAPRHLKAIKDTGNKLVAAVDPHDSVGILDKYGFDIRYFKDIERFDRFMDKLRRQRDERQIDWVSICSPNYLHDAHIRLSLRNSTNVICEKPIVINPWNLDALKVIEEETERKVFTVLQLRVHPELLKLKEEINNKRNRRFQVEMTYITPRGQWYFHSWKGREEFSGGIAVNIGIHLFALLIWLLGSRKSEVHYKTKRNVEHCLENADVVWVFIIDGNDLPMK
jgi:UDP-N-acetyl-2-amino-2-deoxyglucuronate dehydrogenase